MILFAKILIMTKQQHNKVLFFVAYINCLSVFVLHQTGLKNVCFECKVFHFVDVNISQYRLLCNLCFSHNR